MEIRIGTRINMWILQHARNTVARADTYIKAQHYSMDNASFSFWELKKYLFINTVSKQGLM